MPGCEQPCLHPVERLTHPCCMKASLKSKECREWGGGGGTWLSESPYLPLLGPPPPPPDKKRREEKKKGEKGEKERPAKEQGERKNKRNERENES
jgi:hypothetical protein